MRFSNKTPKEKKFIALAMSLITLDMIFLLTSQFTKQWYEGGSDECTWEGDSVGVYDSICYTKENYPDSQCINCDCCSSQNSIHKLGHSILTLIVVAIFNSIWLVVFIVILFKNLDYEGYFIKLLKIFTIPAVFLSIIFFIVECFGITDEKIKAGMVLRLISLILFGIICIVLFNLQQSLKGIVKVSLFSGTETSLGLMGAKDRVEINRDSSLEESK
jgi:hypothetical protein